MANREGDASPLLDAAAADGEVYTTGLWYWRLALAAAAGSTGALSRLLTDLPDDSERSVRDALGQPPGIGILSLRLLVPVMGALSGQPNLLTAEAVAAAVVLDAPILVTTESALPQSTLC